MKVQVCKAQSFTNNHKPDRKSYDYLGEELRDLRSGPTHLVQLWIRIDFLNFFIN